MQNARLLAYRFDPNAGIKVQNDPELLSPEKVGIRWSLEEFGISRIEIVVAEKDEIRAYGRYSDHLGQQISLVSDWFTQPMSGWVYQISLLPGNRVLYTCKGSGRRMKDLYVNQAFAINTDIDAVIDNILDNCDWVDPTRDFVLGNTTDIGGWNTGPPRGLTVYTALKEVREKSGNSNNTFDMWHTENPFILDTDPEPQDYIFHYQPRDSTASSIPVWQISRKDLKALEMTRDIEEVQTTIYVYYGTHNVEHEGKDRGETLSGSDNGVGTGRNQLIDTGTDFVQEGAMVGDYVVNDSDGSAGWIESFSTTTNPNDTISFTDVGMGGGTNNDWDNGDNYQVYTHAYAAALTGGTSTTAIDTAAGGPFFAQDIYPGSKFENYTDGSSSIVGRVDTATTLQLARSMRDSASNTTGNANTERYIVHQLPAIFNTSFNFQSIGIKPGDEVVNITEGSRGTVVRAQGEHLIVSNMQNGTRNRIDNGDVMGIRVSNPTTFHRYSEAATTTYWPVERVYIRPDLTKTQAIELSDVLINQTPRQVQSFTIGSGSVRCGSSTTWPVWEMIAQGGGYLHIPDLFPDELSIDTQELNSITTFRITALDYDHATGDMRVTVDNRDTRLDVTLLVNDILPGDIISRGVPVTDGASIPLAGQPSGPTDSVNLF